MSCCGGRKHGGSSGAPATTKQATPTKRPAKGKLATAVKVTRWNKDDKK